MKIDEPHKISQLEGICHAIKNAFIFTFKLDADGTFSVPYISEGCESVYNLKKEVILNDVSIIMDMVHPEDKEGYLKAIEESAKTLKRFMWTGRTIVNNKIKWGVVQSYPSLQEDNSIIWHGISQDITPTKEKEIEAEKKLEDSLKEKTILLKEIHHRVKNNLQIISSLLNIELRKSNNPEVKSVLSSSRERIEAITYIHQKLYDHTDLSNIDIKEYLKEIAQNLLLSSGKLDLIEFDIESKIDNLNADVAINLGLISAELITNSIKHGYTTNSSNFKIELNLTTEKESICYKYCDNGPGLPSTYNLNNPSNFGFKLIQSLIKKLKGEIIQKKQPKGFQLIITFKK